MTTISATSILASLHSITGDRLDTLLLRYPKCIHAEFMTHRMFSRNAASSRAIPVEKMIQAVLDDPFVPLHWGKNQKGMQAEGECEEMVCIEELFESRLMLSREDAWLSARNDAVQKARAFAAAGYHKQVINRLLEPFMHITVVCSSTNWSNFLALRDHPDAEPHMQMLAREIRKALDGADVQTLPPGDWHLPFITNEEIDEIADRNFGVWQGRGLPEAIKLSVARCASTSYKTVDGFDMTIERAIELHDKLVGSTPLHASPCEHVAQADDVFDASSENFVNFVYQNYEQHGNFVGFRQYRKMLPGECL